MKKLFTDEDYDYPELGSLTRNGSVIDLQDLDLSEQEMDFSDMEDYQSLAVEHMNNLLFKQDIAYSLESSYIKSEPTSKEYFLSMEERSELMKSIANNLGVEILVPAMEDMTTIASVEDSKVIALEGIKEFFKKIWEAIKEFFVVFFKRVKEFAKRLAKAEMELETYEAYLPKMLAKIKTKDLKATDTSASIKSKLPKMVGRPGIYDLDSIYIVRETDLLMGNFIDAVNEQFIPKLRRLKTIDNEHGTIIDKLGSLKRDFSRNPDTLRAHVDSLVDYSRKFTKEVSWYHVGTQDIPYNLSEQFSNLMVRDSKGATEVSSLINVKSDHERLPYYFNIFTVYIGYDTTNLGSAESIDLLTSSYGMSVISNRQKDIVTSNTVAPIVQYDNLSNLYERYKELKNKVKLKELNSLIDSVDRDITKDLNLIDRKISLELEQVKTDLKTMSVGFTDYNLIDAFLNHLKDANIEDKTNPVAVTNYIANLAKLNPSRDVEIYDEISSVVNGIVDKNVIYLKDKARQDIIKEIIKERPFVAIIKAIFEDILRPDKPTMSPEDIALNEKLLTGISKLLSRNFKSFQQVVKCLGTDVSSLYVEFKFEVVKYLYESARRFK